MTRLARGDLPCAGGGDRLSRTPLPNHRRHTMGNSVRKAMRQRERQRASAVGIRGGELAHD
jgi:hypothetical protein